MTPPSLRTDALLLPENGTISPANHGRRLTMAFETPPGTGVRKQARSATLSRWSVAGGWLLALLILLIGSLQAQDTTAPTARIGAEVGEWRDQSRPGYRAQPTQYSVAFYRYIMDKAGRGEEINASESLLIRRMIANRTWPEAPEITARHHAVQDWILRQPENASLFTDPDGWARGRVADAAYERLVEVGLTDQDTPQTEATERFRVFWTGLTPDQRADLPLGEWMYRYYVRLGYDMRSDEQRSQDEAFARKQVELREAGLKEQAEAERQRKEAGAADERQRQKWFEDNWAEEDRRIAREQAERDLIWAEYIAFFMGLAREERIRVLEEMTAEQREELDRRLPEAAGVAPAPPARGDSDTEAAQVKLPQGHHPKPPETTASAVRGSGALDGAAAVAAVAEAEAGRIEGMRAFRVVVPSIWAGASDARGFYVKREAASGGAIYEMCPYPASVYGEVNGKVEPSWGPRSLDEIRQKLEEEAVEHRKWGLEPEIRPFAIGPFPGFLLETRMRFARGGWSHSGYRDSGTSAYGHGWVTSEGRTFEVSYRIGSSGCWDNSQRPFQESQTLAALREAQAILAGLRLVPEPGVTQVPYTGPKLDGSDLPVVRLDPPELGRLNVGDTVVVRAVVENLSPDDRPLRFEWTGEHEGGGGEVLIRATESGTFSLALAVQGAQYALGSASLTYEVADYKASVVRLPRHATGPVYIGARAGFTAELTSGGQPVSGPFVFRWQPHPEVEFDRLDSNTPDVNAVFARPGTHLVWVQVLQQRGDVLSSVAESPQIQVEVLAPGVTIEFDPPTPWAGQEVTARARMPPEVDPDGQWITFRWLPIAGDAQQLWESPDGREIRFYARQEGRITVEVMARTPFHGDSLGGAQRSVEVQPFQIDISDPRFILPPERVVEHQIIEFSTLIRPDPGSGPLRYEWAITAGECRVTNPLYSEARVITGTTGSCKLEVSVRDRNGSLLGTQTKTFPVVSEGGPALIPTPAPPAAIGGPASASPGNVAAEAIQFARVLTGATTGRQYHGYAGGQVVLPHREGGTLRFTFWNDQHQNPGATVNRLTIHIGETTYEVEQYSTALDLQERYQEVPDWGPGGGAVVTVPVPPGVAEVRFGNSGSQTGIELSDLRFDGGSPGEPFGVVAHLNRTSEVQPQFARVLTGATTGRQYHGYAGGQVVLPHREGGTLRFTLWNDQHEGTEQTVNQLTVTAGTNQQSVPLTTSRADIGERFRDLPDWGPAGGKEVQVTVPPGTSTVTFHTQGSQTGMELSGFSFQHSSDGDPAQERLPEPRAATPPSGTPEARTPRPQSIPTVAREEVMQLPVVMCTSTGQVCEPGYEATFTGAGEVAISYTAGDRHCADVAVRVRVDDLPQQETGFASAGQTTASLRFALPNGGPHRLSVTGIGREGGCNTGALLGWTGSLTLEWRSPGL